MERPPQDQYRLLQEIQLEKGALRLWSPLTDASASRNDLAQRADLLRQLLLHVCEDRICADEGTDMSDFLNDL